MICFYCLDEIKPEEKKTMYPVEVPYMNLWVHKVCLSGKKDKEIKEKIVEFIEYLKKNKKMWYNI